MPRCLRRSGHCASSIPVHASHASCTATGCLQTIIGLNSNGIQLLTAGAKKSLLLAACPRHWASASFWSSKRNLHQFSIRPVAASSSLQFILLQCTLFAVSYRGRVVETHGVVLSPEVVERQRCSQSPEARRQCKTHLRAWNQQRLAPAKTQLCSQPSGYIEHAGHTKRQTHCSVV